MNGNSAQLPVPDRSVDAVITDPPYFDFVHYSELSDFFYAWLAPSLKDRYRWFDRANSFAVGEVQHKDPRIFAEQLALVFAECHRVLKGDGVLTFSFHHSRPEGWAAIYEAVTNSGFAVVVAHPIHAELRAASPKSAATDPISLDAILVCKKQIGRAFGTIDESAVVRRADDLINTLQTAGIELSKADRFVIMASQTLVGLNGHQMYFDNICRVITDQWQHLSQPTLESP